MADWVCLVGRFLIGGGGWAGQDEPRVCSRPTLRGSWGSFLAFVSRLPQGAEVGGGLVADVVVGSSVIEFGFS